MNYQKWWQVISYRVYRAWINLCYSFPFQNVARDVILVVMENRRARYSEHGEAIRVKICRYGVELRRNLLTTNILWKDLPYIPKGRLPIKLFNLHGKIDALCDVIQNAERCIGLP